MCALLQARCSFYQQVAFRPRLSSALFPKADVKAMHIKCLGFQSAARVNWGLWFRDISFSKSKGPRFPVCDGTVHHLPSAGHFLGLFVAPRNTLKTASYHWSRGGLRRAGRPSVSTYTPLYSPLLTLHTLRKPHMALHHLSVRCQFTHLSPSPLLHPSGSASLRTFRLSFFPSFPPRPSIHPVGTPSVLSRPSCQDEWQRCLPGTCCFINMADSLGLLCGLCNGQNM